MVLLDRRLRLRQVVGRLLLVLERLQLLVEVKPLALLPNLEAESRFLRLVNLNQAPELERSRLRLLLSPSLGHHNPILLNPEEAIRRLNHQRTIAFVPPSRPLMKTRKIS